MTTIIPLTIAEVSLARAGGKGRSLARLLSAGMPVPPGFIIATDAYQEFIDANKLQEVILEITANGIGQLHAADEAEANIRALFAAADIPTKTERDIKRAYADLNGRRLAVAVRSSATAEDLPDLSFAGQQDSYLNVRGESALLTALRSCWSSLWNARAISYREQKGISHRDVAMAVVVQTMVPADVAGILFTANPATGDRSEIIINASFGLGEAIVSGQVTPDSYLLNRDDLEVKQTIIGTKDKMTVSMTGQGTTALAVTEGKRKQSSLTDAMLNELAALGLKVEFLFEGIPQDIEWALVNDKFYLLQSRPITSLPNIVLSAVEWNPPTAGTKLIRRQVVENMPEPLSPLFEDLYLLQGLDRSIDQMLMEFGMPFNLEEFMERPMFLTVNGYAYCRASYKLGWSLLRTMPKILYWYVSNLKKLIRNLIPMWRDDGLPHYLETVNHWRAVDRTSAADEKLFCGIRTLASADATYWFYISFVMGAAKITDGMLHYFLTSRVVRGELTSGMFLQGFPSKTLQAQLELEAIAREVNTTTTLRELLIQTPVTELLQRLKQHRDGASLQNNIQQYLEHYGHQIYNLDFVQPTQIENPLPVLLSLKTLVKNADYDTRKRQIQMAKERETLIDETLQSLGPIRRSLFRKLLHWAQIYGPNREEALFYMGAAWPTLRGLALELGSRLAEIGTIDKPDKVFYLKSCELIEAFTARARGQALPEMAQLATSRWELREARKKLHPPPMVPEKSRFKFGPLDLSALETQKRNQHDNNMLEGFAVSPGKITASASVILSAADFEKMEPNTILVCATTTPAWTPLLAQSLGLVTDIGGMLAHGSIVAREYGIPAVMGTGNITQRIVTGQKIMVDGDRGTVTILD